MKYITVENALEAQVGGHFYHFAVGSYNVEDELADFLVSNYNDRGVVFGILPSEGGPEPLPMPEPEAAVEVEVEPDTDTDTIDKPSTRRSRTRTA